MFGLETDKFALEEINIPQWAKQERLEYIISQKEIRGMSRSAAVKKEDKWNWNRHLKNIIKSLRDSFSECAKRKSFPKILFRKPLSEQS